jgi:hypothetical protein
VCVCVCVVCVCVLYVCEHALECIYQSIYVRKYMYIIHVREREEESVCVCFVRARESTYTGRRHVERLGDWDGQIDV